MIWEVTFGEKRSVPYFKREGDPVWSSIGKIPYEEEVGNFNKVGKEGFFKTRNGKDSLLKKTSMILGYLALTKRGEESP